jgi:hypothetical protein
MLCPLLRCLLLLKIKRFSFLGSHYRMGIFRYSIFHVEVSSRITLRPKLLALLRSVPVCLGYVNGQLHLTLLLIPKPALPIVNQPIRFVYLNPPSSDVRPLCADRAIFSKACPETPFFLVNNFVSTQCK